MIVEKEVGVSVLGFTGRAFDAHSRVNPGNPILPDVKMAVQNITALSQAGAKLMGALRKPR